MALDLNALQRDINYFKDLKEKPARLHGEDKTFLEVIAAMKDKSKLSSSERLLVEQWVQELEAKKDYFSDSVARTRLEALKKEIMPISTGTPIQVWSNNSTNPIVWTSANLGHTVPGSINNPVEIQNGTKEIKEALSEINPENLEKAVTISEKFINILPDGQAKSTLRGIHGAIIFDVLRTAGHNLTMQNGQITIIPKPGTDVVNLQEKLQTLVNTKRISLETIKLGMLYSSPSFAKYAEMKKTKDMSGKEIIDPKASTEDFMIYLSDIQKTGNKSGDIETLIASRAMLTGISMPQAIQGFKDMGQIGAWMEKNVSVAAKVVQAWAAASNNSVTTTSPSSHSTPSNRLTNQLGQDGKTGWAVTGIVKDSANGLFGGIGDIFKLANGDPAAQLGIGAAFIYGVYKLFSKLWFLWGVGTLFGIGALNSGSDISDRIKKLFGGESTKPATTPAVATTTPTPTPAAQPAVAPPTITPETPSQKTASDKIRANPELKALLDPAKLTGKKKNAPLEKYITFINTDLKDKNADIFYKSADNNHNIFSNTNLLDPSISLPADLDPVIFKSIMRMYITGTYMSSIKMDEPANVAIIRTQIGKVTAQNPTLSQAIEQIQK